MSKSRHVGEVVKRIIDESMRASLNITGRNIRIARERAGLTQGELSAKLETKAIYVCRGSVSRIENGSRAVTDIELKAISEVLHTSIESFFKE